MAANRKTLAPSNTMGDILGADFLEDNTEEVEALWRYACVPLTGVGGAPNAITATCPVPLLAAQLGNGLMLTPIAANTGATTLNAGAGVKPLVNRDGTALTAGRLAAGRMEPVFDDGTSYRLLTDKPASTAAPQVSVFTYQLAAGTNGQAVVAGWQTFPFNTQVQNDVTGLVFTAGSSTFTLPAGTVEVEAHTPGGQYNSGLFLWDVAAAAPVTAGITRLPEYNYNSPRLIGKVTQATPKDYRIRLYATAATDTLGRPLNITAPATLPEQYGFVSFKVYP